VASSSRFRILETDEFRKGLNKLPVMEASFLRRKLEGYVYPLLREAPFFGPNIGKLKGYVPETWRYRIGRFRVFCRVDEAMGKVSIISVDLRRDAYR